MMLDAVGLAELRAQARRDEVQGRFAQRGSLDGIKRAFLRTAVLLEPALEQDREGRLAAGGRAQEEQQSPADIRSRSRGLEVVDDTPERLVDAEQFALEELAGLLRVAAALGGAAVPEQHVPDVFVAGANERRRALGQDVFQEIAERAFPALRAMFLAEPVQRIQKIRRTGPLF